MSRIASPILVVLLTLCPILCGAEEFDHGAQRHRQGAPGGSSHDGQAPDHCPADVDNCICQGAVWTDHVRVQGADVPPMLRPFLELVHTPAHPLAHLTREGSPTGLAGWGDATGVRSFLQIFRC